MTKYNPETTQDYFVKRNSRMKSHMSEDKQLKLLIANECGLKG